LFTNEDIIETALESTNLKNKNVLVAGGGRLISRAVIDRNPKKLTCVCEPDNNSKAERIFNELGGERNDAEVITASLSQPGLFNEATFDIVIADFLIGKIDNYAPGKHMDILQFLKEYLAHDGELILIDIEPDLIPLYPNDSLLTSDNHENLSSGNSKMVLDDITRYRLYRRIRMLVVDLALNHGIPGFREIPGEWVEKWLIGIGFDDVEPQLATRTVSIDIVDEHEKKIRSLIELITDSKSQKYIEALLDRSEGILREVCPFDYEQDIYIITAKKG